MITQILWLLKNRIDSRLVTSFVLSLSLTVTTTAVAKYNPPPDQRPPGGYTTSSGSRGVCGVSGGTPLTVLAPQKHVGQTTSTHPTFAWFVPDYKPLPMEFILYQYNPGSAPKLVHKIELQSSQEL